MIHQSLRFHASHFSGALVSQANRFASAYQTLTDTFIVNILQLFVSVVLSIVIIAYFVPAIALFMAIWVIFFIWLNIWMTGRRIHLSKQVAQADSAQTAHLADSIGNIAAVKAFGNEQAEHNIYHARTADWAVKRYRAWIRASRNDFVLGVLMVALRVVVLALSIYAVMQGRIALGTFLLVHIYVTQLINLLWNFSNLSRTIEQNISDAAEMTGLLKQDIAVKDPTRPQQVRITRGAIAFDQVNFTHADTVSALFCDFSLTIQPGEKIGLVGHSGAGKSTLTSLLLRFADVDGGAITIDGQNITAVRQSELRQHIAYVPQEPVLFHRSLRENIAYGNPNATDAQIAEAARQAHAAEFIDQLPQGYDTLVGERGVKLSGGQRQRIAIARAIIKDAPVLVLDEATSALDSESERLIQDALARLMHGRTTIVIAHRLSTIQRLDRIVVLDQGRIIEDGNHEELLATKGTYAQLWAHQSGGFLDD